MFKQSYDTVLSEIRECEKIAEQYPRNYYAWTYRQLVSLFIPSADEIESHIDSLTKWTKRHVSDHCAYHYRHFLWSRFIHFLDMPLANAITKGLNNSEHIVEEETDCKISPEHAERIYEFWKTEFVLSTNLLTNYPGHESLWCHRRSLVVHWTMVLQCSASVRSLCESDSYIPTQSDPDAEVESVNLSLLFERELHFVKRHITDDGISQYEKNKRFAVSYLTWLFALVSPHYHTQLTNSHKFQRLVSQDSFHTNCFGNTSKEDFVTAMSLTEPTRLIAQLPFTPQKKKKKNAHLRLA